MSLVVSWIGIDTHGVTSAYVASDSRVSWGNNYRYDCCRKTFYSKHYPEIIGYCGDVLFASLILTTLIENIDNHLVFSKKDNAYERYEKFKKKLSYEFHNYPKDPAIMNSAFEIIYINREIIQKGYPDFFAYHLKWTKGNRLKTTHIKLKPYSGIIKILGSGSSEFSNNYKNYQSGKNKNTTRNVYHCFTDTLKRMQTSTCGGPPQLVGLYRKPKSKGFSFGLLHQRKRYYAGMKVGRNGGPDTIQWRNDNFEIVSSLSNKIIGKAQPKDSSSATP